MMGGSISDVYLYFELDCRRQGKDWTPRNKIGHYTRVSIAEITELASDQGDIDYSFQVKFTEQVEHRDCLV